jgi:hypothetical protein
MSRRTKRLVGLGLFPSVGALALVAAIAWRHGAAGRAVAARDRAMAAATGRLRAFDAARRQSADFASLPTWDRQSGPDPYAIQELPGSGFLIGLLRGADAVVVLDPSLHEVQRLPAPRSPSALAVAGDAVFVAGELDTAIARFRWTGAALAPAGVAPLADVRAVRGLAAGPRGWIYLIEEQRGRLIALEVAAGATAADPGRDGGAGLAGAAGGALRFARRRDLTIGNGPIRIERVADRLIVDCLLDHALVIQRLAADGAPSGEAPLRIVHDGPIWSFAARATEGGGALVIAAGGVEDHPLDRTIGAFGYIDSFLYVYRVDLAGGRVTRRAAIDLGDHGLVLPKALALDASAQIVRVAGYGTDGLLEIGLESTPPSVTSSALVPGTSALIERSGGGLVFADPLLDAWIAVRPGGHPQVVPVPAPAARDPELRLGEALIFTTLMAPWNRSEGPLSRFTCETCHFEGYGDGRIHHTGRGDVHAVTKPLLGLFNNRPHFSRALDPDLTSVAFNEFRVAGQRSDHDPWFGLRTADVPWLAWLGLGDDWISPERLRRAFISFLMAFNHRPNPATLGRRGFTALEAKGAAVFRARCEGCHQARLSSDDPASRAPFDRWEDLVMNHDGPIVWGEAAYQKTGVVPYVHAEGARVPSLRRLYKKHPYFTNGSAPDLNAVLTRARFAKAGSGFWHEQGDGDRDSPDGPGAGDVSALDQPDRRALLAFLDLL